MVGIDNVTVVTMEKITQIANGTTPTDFLVRSNQIIYGGVYWFSMLWILWIILYFAANKVKDQPLNNLMYSSASISILAFFLRAMSAVMEGTKYTLITDHQLWVFPIITSILALIIWSIKD